MFVEFFFALRKGGVPASLNEYLTLLAAMERGVAGYGVQRFYYLSRSCLVKDERNLDRFDRVFGTVFRGLDPGGAESLVPDIPDDWLRRMSELYLTEEERQAIAALGGWETLMETLRRRLEEQHERHQGGSHWIGTAGTSPFGAHGYNPEGVRVGQHESRHRRAVKIWDRREFRNLDDTVALGTRNIKIALRRLRRFAREGAATELDLDATIHATAQRGGMLDLRMVPERHNTVKVLLFLDSGGSMDDHVRTMAELFSAARSEFKHLEHFYFHNCVYETVWRDNIRRHDERTPTDEIIRTFPGDYRLVFVGDASMGPYEISHPGGSIEHWNREAGAEWMTRLLDAFPHAVWLNPVEQAFWRHTQSIGMMARLLDGRMFPLTLDGLDRAMRALKG
ncbi:MAG: VWA domain-containing protein [Alphaproteobacteria bacterium]